MAEVEEEEDDFTGTKEKPCVSLAVIITGQPTILSLQATR